MRNVFDEINSALARPGRDQRAGTYFENHIPPFGGAQALGR